MKDTLIDTELRETKLKALREHLVAAIREGGSYTDAEVAAILAEDKEEHSAKF